MSKGALVLDANVLIGFHKAGWFESLAFWTPDYDLLVPKTVWDDEFKSRRDIETHPEWLSVIKVTDRIDPANPGQLSQNDWCGLLLAQSRDAILITSDKRLKDRAEDEYEIVTKWSGSFLLDTFTRCGIDTEDYQLGISDYISDSYLPKPVCDELRDAEKS